MDSKFKALLTLVHMIINLTYDCSQMNLKIPSNFQDN